MGIASIAKCLDCGKTSQVCNGGGFFFHLLHCDKCGEAKSVGFDELGELHERYLKGLSGPYSAASMEHDKCIQDHAQVRPISESEYNRGIERIAGGCTCGGKYTLNAPPRCSFCHSDHLHEYGREDGDWRTCLDCGEFFKFSDDRIYRDPREIFSCDKCGQHSGFCIDDTLNNLIPGRGKKVDFNCKCGGKFTLSAPPRCPKCNSTQLQKEGETCYD